MRTTLTLEDDLALKLKRRAERTKSSFKQTVNEVLRRGLAAQEAHRDPGEPYRVETFCSAFCSGVDPLKLNQINDEMEARRATEPPSRYGE